MSDIYRLAKPRKKGLIHLLFSRFFVIVLLLIVQLLLVISFYGWLKSLIPFFSAITVAFTVGGIIYLFNSGMDSAAKLTWMFIIALLPISGAAMLAFTQMNLGHRTIKRRAAEMIDMTAGAALRGLSHAIRGSHALMKTVRRVATRSTLRRFTHALWRFARRSFDLSFSGFRYDACWENDKKCQRQHYCDYSILHIDSSLMGDHL